MLQADKVEQSQDTPFEDDGQFGHLLTLLWSPHVVPEGSEHWSRPGALLASEPHPARHSATSGRQPSSPLHHQHHCSGFRGRSCTSLAELIEMLAISRNQKLLQPGEENQVLELLIHRDGEFQELMKLALNQGKIHHEMQVLEKEVEKRDSDIQQLQKQLKEAEQILATAVYQAKEKLKSVEKARKGAISSEEIIKYAHRISASNAVCAPLTWVPGDPRRPYPTDLEMRSGLLGQMNNPPSNGVNGHLPGDALAAGRLPDVLAPQYPWQSSEMSINMLPPNHGSDFLLEPPGHNKENEDDVEVMSTDSSSSSSDSD